MRSKGHEVAPQGSYQIRSETKLRQWLPDRQLEESPQQVLLIDHYRIHHEHDPEDIESFTKEQIKRIRGLRPVLRILVHVVDQKLEQKH